MDDFEKSGLVRSGRRDELVYRIFRVRVEEQTWSFWRLLGGTTVNNFSSLN